MALHAQGLESVMSPGELSQSHTKIEGECKQCHMRFDRKAQDGLCMACHKEIAADLRGKTGWHGRKAQDSCKSCHTEHKGRQARIVDFKTDQFDHSQTDFQLQDKHAKAECKSCHVSGKKYREAASTCVACHRKDDDAKGHKGQLGTQCQDCHSPAGWKPARFDHDKTRFALTGKHSQAQCADCHKNNAYKDTSRTCVACHRKDDDSKGHKGLLGDKCDSCHRSNGWKPSTFDHDQDTRYALRGQHRSAACKDCHTSPPARTKLSQDCYACHERDDKHQGTLGKQCASCHTERGWKEPAKFDHNNSNFPLLGKHASVECKSCHLSARFKDAASDCYACHRNSDKHQQTLGTDCAACHTERSWKMADARFRHDSTRFALRNGHASDKVSCSACHKDLQSFRKTPLACVACHRKNDKHQGQLGEQCESCHRDSSWRTTSFDHAKTRFPLVGRHNTVVCKDCHSSQRFKDTASDCYSCHQKVDKHKGRLGTDCASCHNSRSWALWSFDHNQQTRYRLDGSHRKLRCDSCHTQVAPAGKRAAPVAGTCVDCHKTEDAHDGQFGRRCEQCHSTESWHNPFQRTGG